MGFEMALDCVEIENKFRRHEALDMTPNLSLVRRRGD